MRHLEISLPLAFTPAARRRIALSRPLMPGIIGVERPLQGRPRHSLQSLHLLGSEPRHLVEPEQHFRFREAAHLAAPHLEAPAAD